MPSSPRTFAGAASSSTSFPRRSCVVRASGAVAILIGARCFVEAVAFTCIAAIAPGFTTGTVPLPIVPWTLVLFGIGFLLVTLPRGGESERRGAPILIVTAARGGLLGPVLPARDPPGF